MPRTYREGFADGFETGYSKGYKDGRGDERDVSVTIPRSAIKATKRKLSAWQKYIKNKRNHIKFRDGKLNLKKMGVAFRRKKR